MIEEAKLDNFAKMVMAMAKTAKDYNQNGQNGYCNDMLAALNQDAYNILSMPEKEKLGAMTVAEIDRAMKSILQPTLEDFPDDT